MENALWFAEQIHALNGVYLIREPMLNIVSFGAKNLKTIERALKGRGWGISAHRGYIRIVMMPHVKREHLEGFLKDLREILATL